MTLFGIVMEVKEEHPKNAQFPIVATLFGMVIDFRDEQKENAPSPIVVTLFEMEKLLFFFPQG